MNKDTYNILVKNGFVDFESNNYVWIPEMIFLDSEKINYYNNDRYDYLNTENYFIFAKNVYGDFYAWDKNDESVIFCDQGSGYGTFFAPNLSSAIFRIIIEFASGEYADFCFNEEKEEMNSDEAEKYICEKEAIELMELYRNCFSVFFQKEWIEVLDNFINNGFTYDNSFIDEIKQMELIKQYINCKELNDKVNLNPNP